MAYQKQRQQNTLCISQFEPSYSGALTAAHDEFMEIQNNSVFDINYQRECYYVKSLIEKNWVECGDNVDYALACCTPASITMTLVMAAHMGLSFNPTMRQAYLIPRVNAKSKVLECTLSIAWRGLVQIGLTSKAIVSAVPTLVYENDEFIYHGTARIPDHSYDPFLDKSARGKIRGGYCIARLPNGGIICTPVSLEKLNELRPTYTSVWDYSPEEMMLKSLIRQSYDSWPVPLSFSSRLNSKLITSDGNVLAVTAESAHCPPVEQQTTQQMIAAVPSQQADSQLHDVIPAQHEDYYEPDSQYRQ